MAISVDVRPNLSRQLFLLCAFLILALDDTMPESHMSHLSEHEISEHEPVSQLRRRRTRRIKAYCLDTDESAFSMTDEEPLIYEEEDSTFCDDRPSEGTWVEEEEEEVAVIRIGPVSWIAAQILPRYHDQEVTQNIELNVFEDAVNRVSPYAELRDATCDADFQKILDSVRGEWRWGMNIVRSRSPKRLSQMLTPHLCSSWHSRSEEHTSELQSRP